MAGKDSSSLFDASNASLSLRAERDSDEVFLEALYGTTRAEEMAQVGWSEARANAFIAGQFRAQRAHYREHYTGAEFLVVECSGVRVGRLYLHETACELRLMDILLAPDWRGRGLGRSLFLMVADRAFERGLPITLHVEPFNPACAWYGRLGFERVEERGIYWFMQLPAERLTAAREKLLVRS